MPSIGCHHDCIIQSHDVIEIILKVMLNPTLTAKYYSIFLYNLSN